MKLKINGFEIEGNRDELRELVFGKVTKQESVVNKIENAEAKPRRARNRFMIGQLVNEEKTKQATEILRAMVANDGYSKSERKLGLRKSYIWARINTWPDKPMREAIYNQIMQFANSSASKLQS